MKQQKSSKNLNSSILYLLFFFTIVILICFGRLFQLAVVKESNGVNLTQYQQAEERSSVTGTRRGTIYDSSGHPLAIDTTSYSIYAVLQDGWKEGKIEDYDQAASILSQHLNLSRGEILQRLLDNKDLQQVEFGVAGSHLSSQQKEAIEATGLSGVGFKESRRRYYVNDFYASHLLGYATLEADSDHVFQGQLGVEAAFDEELNGVSELDVPGRDLLLTIDSRIQQVLEKLLQENYQKYQPENLQAYVVDLSNGHLLAAGQRPSFNLNNREGIEDEWRHLLVEDSFEPGSTIKILTTATAIDAGVYEGNKKYQSGNVDVYDQTVHDYNVTGWGEITYDEGLARSSNVLMVKLVEDMGLETWQKALASFGFGKSSQSGLLNESSGLIDFDNPVNAIMSGFGQGLLTTPIQLLNAYSAVANQGRIQPLKYLIDEEKGGSQLEAKQVVSPEAANHILKVMVDTVEAPYGTAQSFKHTGLKVAAKTGTAQIADPNGNGYLTGPNDYIHSVIAFLPADQPQYMVYLTMKQPQKSQGLLGSQILAEVFHPLVDNLIIKE
ncbi:peptidoglycan D,D-transpeptidase FtsI family protein [Hutsoniella sourekii]